MVFLLIEKYRLNSLESGLHYKVNKFAPRILSEKYELVYIMGRSDDILEVLLRDNINARFLLPLVSRTLFSIIFGEELIRDKNIQPIYLSESILENILALDKEVYPVKETVYYNIGDLFSVENNNINSLIDANNILEDNSLLIGADGLRISLRDILVLSIKRTLEKERRLSEEDPEYSREDEDFFFDGLYEFLLLARKYYNKDEVEEFIKEEFKDILGDDNSELDSRD